MPDVNPGGPHFDERKVIQDDLPKFVCWLDVMGTASTLAISVRKAQIFVGKLHVAMLEAYGGLSSKDQSEILLFPFVDGLYVVTPNSKVLFDLLKRVFVRLARLFISETRPDKRFLIRAGIAYGQVSVGKNLTRASYILGTQSSELYVRNMLLGAPLAKAHTVEHCAAPYSVWIDETARTAIPNFATEVWRWWTWRSNELDETNSLKLAQDLKKKIVEHLGWCSDNSPQIGYDVGRISAHRNMVVAQLP